MICQMFRRLLAVAGILLFLATGNASAAFTNMYVFGDSLSDSGNAKAQNLLTPYVPGITESPRPGTNVIGGPGYYLGRVTNGLNYADVLAQSLGLSAEASLNGGTNYAYGGARTSYHIYNFALIPGAQPNPGFMGMTQQVSRYLSDHGGLADPDALYVVFGGVNNLQDMLANAPFRLSMAQTITDLRQMLIALHGAGAQHFLVPNAPDLSLTPRVRANGAAAVAGGHALSLVFNGALDAMLNGLDAQVGYDIDKLDTFSLFTDVFNNPAKFGFSNVTTPCNLGADDLFFTRLGTICGDVGERLFWDSIHPTNEAHAILGQAALLAIPEPQTLLLVTIALATLVRTSRRAPAELQGSHSISVG